MRDLCQTHSLTKIRIKILMKPWVFAGRILFPSRIIQAVQNGKLCMTLVVPPLDDSIPPGVDEAGSQTGYRLNLGFNTAKVGLCIWQHVLKHTICIRYIYIHIL